MGFWSGFLGHAAANAYNEIIKEEKETQRWNDLFNEISNYETLLNNYLRHIGCLDSYVIDIECVNNGNILSEKRKMDILRRKCEEYISLGGQGKYLYHLQDIDEYIEIMKYLKSVGCVDRQEEFLGLTLEFAQTTIKNEEKEFQREIESSDINSLSGVLNGKIREFFNDQWDKFKTNFYEFDACLEGLIDTTNLREKINALDAVISGLKLYESYLMASKMPHELQAEMFAKIMRIMDVEKYENYESKVIYSAMLVNDDELRDNIKSVVIPSEDYTAGMFWTFLLAASDEIGNYSYIKDLLNYHGSYLVALGASVQCFIDNNILDDVITNYCGYVHALIETYIENKM